mmetsp:Transcript_20321/g.38245  ORF Transcript_20321/g.38245 Transcript_20321/m.38245 type:complete len:85 (-) Transcript_20321:157-411(-)
MFRPERSGWCRRPGADLHCQHRLHVCFMCTAHSIIAKNPGVFSEQKQLAMYGIPALLFAAGVFQKASAFLLSGCSSKRTNNKDA